MSDILGITIAIPYIFMNCKIIWVFFVNEKVTITDLDFSTILAFQSWTQDYYLVTLTLGNEIPVCTIVFLII